MAPASLTLQSGELTAQLLPEEGAALSTLTWRGVSILASTPWADAPPRVGHAAATEAEWVDRWRGGWQLCAPSTGQPSPESPWFHGEASLTPWRVLRVTDASAELEWRSPDGALRIARRWQLSDGSQTAVHTTVTNAGRSTRHVQLAEHLVLGSGFVAAALDRDHVIDLTLPPAEIGSLDYAGLPAPADAGLRDSWATLDRHTPARVSALIEPSVRSVTARAGELSATVSWSGLKHALLWAELGATQEAPWNGDVVALGIEPTSTPHGAGIAGGQAIELAPGMSVTTSTSLVCERAEGTP